MDQKVFDKTLKETAVLVGIITQHQNEKKSKEYLEELAFLTETAGANPLRRFTQKVSKPNPKTFIGSGKINEILSLIILLSVSISVSPGPFIPIPPFCF